MSPNGGLGQGHAPPYNPAIYTRLLFSRHSEKGCAGMSRNELIASIVVALGGTVTDPNNRNQLLRDWLAALNP